MVKADAHRQAVAHEFDVAPHAPLHVAGRQHAVQRAREGAHDLVADGLDDAAAVLLADLAQGPEHRRDQAAGFLVALGLEQPRAAADVGEQDGLGARLAHAGSLGDGVGSVMR